LILLKLADPKRPIQYITKELVGSSISVRVNTVVISFSLEIQILLSGLEEASSRFEVLLFLFSEETKPNHCRWLK
jgi:hypothetical protein